MTSEFLSKPVNRRQFAIGGVAGAAALTLLPTRSIFAAGAQNASDLSSLDYQELKITVTDTSFEGVPASTAAGRYLLTVTAQTSKGPGNVAFVSPTPVGMSAADLIQALTGMAGPPAGASPQAGGTPPAGGDQGGGQQIPLPFYQMYFAGGGSALPGDAVPAVIDLKPGEYMVWGDDPTASQKPTVLKVTGDFPADVKDPASDLTATLIDFAISFDGKLTAGKHLLKVQNHGAQPHFLELDKGPDTMTKETMQAVLMGEMSGTPAAGAFSEQDLKPALYTPVQSIGTVTWHPVELQAGTYLAACFFPTAGTGVPHAMNGMIDVFKVSG